MSGSCPLKFEEKRETDMDRPKVLVTSRSFASKNAEPIRLLEEHGFEVVRIVAGEKSVEEQVREQLPGAVGVIAGLDRYDRDLLEKCKDLKVISRYGVGYDKVDVAAARELGIAVTITPGANENSVADLAYALMLSACRNVAYSDRTLRAGAEKRPMGMEMWQKTIGVVGTGRIGKGVIRRAKGFEMKVLCYDVYPDEAFAKEQGAAYVPLDELLKQSDFISLHTPLTEKTRNMIGQRELKLMKPTAVLVNTARGGIVDEQALYEALKAGTIAAAGLDAMVFEPPVESPLLTLDNFVATSHFGGTTDDAVHKMSMMAVENLIAVIETGSSPYALR